MKNIKKLLVVFSLSVFLSLSFGAIAWAYYTTVAADSTVDASATIVGVSATVMGSSRVFDSVHDSSGNVYVVGVRQPTGAPFIGSVNSYTYTATTGLWTNTTISTPAVTPVNVGIARASDGTLGIVYTEPTNRNIYYSTSTDGITWSAPSLVVTTDAGISPNNTDLVYLDNNQPFIITSVTNIAVYELHTYKFVDGSWYHQRVAVSGPLPDYFFNGGGSLRMEVNGSNDVYLVIGANATGTPSGTIRFATANISTSAVDDTWPTDSTVVFSGVGDSPGAAGPTPASTALDSDGNLWIVAADNNGIGTTDYVYYGMYNGSSWTTDTVVSGTDLDTQVVDIALDGTTPYVSYFDKTNRTANYAYYNGNRWISSTIYTPESPTNTVSCQIEKADGKMVALVGYNNAPTNTILGTNSFTISLAVDEEITSDQLAVKMADDAVVQETSGSGSSTADATQIEFQKQLTMTSGADTVVIPNGLKMTTEATANFRNLTMTDTGIDTSTLVQVDVAGAIRFGLTDTPITLETPGTLLTITKDVGEGHDGDTFDIYRSEDDVTWTANTPDDSCVVSGTTCTFTTDGLSDFGMGEEISFQTMYVNELGSFNDMGSRLDSATDSNGDVHLVEIGAGPGGGTGAAIAYRKYTASTHTWGTKSELISGIYPGLTVKISVNPSTNYPGIVYTYQDGTNYPIKYTSWDGHSWDEPVDVYTPATIPVNVGFTYSANDSDGTAYIVAKTPVTELGTEIYLYRGSRIGFTETAVNTGSENMVYAMDLDIEVYDSNVYIMTAPTLGYTAVYGFTSTNGGVSFGARQTLISGVTGSSFPQIKAALDSSGQPRFVYFDDATPNRVYFVAMSGDTWGISQTLTTNLVGSTHAKVGFMNDGTNDVFVWNDKGSTSLKYSFSPNGGVSWSTPAEIVTGIYTGPGLGGSATVAKAGTSDWLVVDMNQNTSTPPALTNYYSFYLSTTDNSEEASVPEFSFYIYIAVLLVAGGFIYNRTMAKRRG